MFSALAEPQDGGNMMEGLIIYGIWFTIIICFVALIIIVFNLVVNVTDDECPYGDEYICNKFLIVGNISWV